MDRFTLTGKAADGSRVPLHGLWSRRQATKFNGASYIVQRGAEAAYTDAGQQQIQTLIDHYMANAAVIRNNLTKLGLSVYGGVNAPYVWVKTPNGLSSWDLFDKLLTETHVVCTPGSGFGWQSTSFASWRRLSLSTKSDILRIEVGSELRECR